MEQAATAVTSQGRSIEPEPATLVVKCMLCEEIVAITTLERLSYPIKGGMFDSPDPDHGIPAPWQPNEEWADMRCPYGRIHRAMVTPRAILTESGIVCVNPDGASLDMEVTHQRVEVGRESISDRVMQVPDDVAEKIARAELNKGAGHGEAEAGPGEPADDKPIKEKKAEERTAKRRKG